MRFGAGLILGLTLLAVAINGYHPYTEDGGLYLAAARHALDPTLYPHDSAFVTAPSRFSLFAPLIAALVSLTMLPQTVGLAVVAFALHLATIFGTLAAAWFIACRSWSDRRARTGAVLLLACWASLPVAGTSLLLMDPYLTARSFSAPCLLLALLGVLLATADEPRPNDRRNGLALWIASIAVATAMHPLMAAYAVAASIPLAWVRVGSRKTRWGGLALIGAAVCATTSVLNISDQAELPGYTQVALTRTYWFLFQWHWYELAGIICPVLILLAFARSARRRGDDPGSTTQEALAIAALAAAATATAVAAIFARHPEDVMARLQPLRELQFAYLVMLLLLGGWLGESVLRGRPRRWLAAAVVLSAPMFLAARSTTPASAHMEFPWSTPRNPWVRAFVWIRENTPKDALFALYPDYVHAPGEDAQCFRALAERSVLPDYSKDGGEASIAPELTLAWTIGQAAQQNLATETDAARRAKLQPLGVTWVVLEASAPTSLTCPYRSAEIAVCRL